MAVRTVRASWQALSYNAAVKLNLAIEGAVLQKQLDALAGVVDEYPAPAGVWLPVCRTPERNRLLSRVMTF